MGEREKYEPEVGETEGEALSCQALQHGDEAFDGIGDERSDRETSCEDCIRNTLLTCSRPSLCTGTGIMKTSFDRQR